MSKVLLAYAPTGLNTWELVDADDSNLTVRVMRLERIGDKRYMSLSMGGYWYARDEYDTDYMTAPMVQHAMRLIYGEGN